MTIEATVQTLFASVTDDETLKSVLTAILSAEAQLYDGENEEFLQKSILFGRCDEAHFRLTNTQNMISNTGTELRELLENFDGSEVADTRVQAKTKFLTSLSHQADLYQLRLDAAVKAHNALVDINWTPRSKRSKNTKAETASKMEALALLADLGLDKSPKKPAKAA